jgi:hypothetical protein
MPSFDVMLEPNWVELRNAVEQTNREIGTRFDFKGSSASVELAGEGDSRSLATTADSDFQLQQVHDILRGKLAKRGVDQRFLTLDAKPEKIGGDKIRQTAAVKCGIDSDSARKIQSLVKGSKLKVQAQIQGDVVRVSGAKRDDLQAALRQIRSAMTALPLSFGNMRE